MLAEESIADISSEVEYARRQEIELRTSGELTADRIQWFGILSIFILLTVSVWQVIYLRHFFTTKKLL
jgi:p24 family protein delta-1